MKNKGIRHHSNWPSPSCDSSFICSSIPIVFVVSIKTFAKATSLQIQCDSTSVLFLSECRTCGSTPPNEHITEVQKSGYATKSTSNWETLHSCQKLLIAFSFLIKPSNLHSPLLQNWNRFSRFPKIKMYCFLHAYFNLIPLFNLQFLGPKHCKHCWRNDNFE